MSLNITIVGSGNVAWNLAFAIGKTSHKIVQIVSQNEENAKALAKHFGAYYGSSLSKIYGDSDLVIVSIKDDAYSFWARDNSFEDDVIVCHTSGPVPMDVLEHVSNRIGVFYPLQSFNKDRLKNFDDVPLLIEGSDAAVERVLMDLASELSNKVSVVNSENRKKYHLSAVFANNFTNVMYLSAQRYLEHEGLDFDVLRPIIYETALKMRDHLPHEVQTGPAKRKDLKVIQEQKDMIKDPLLKEIYSKLSQLIMDMNS